MDQKQDLTTANLGASSSEIRQKTVQSASAFLALLLIVIALLSFDITAVSKAWSMAVIPAGFVVYALINWLTRLPNAGDRVWGVVAKLKIEVFFPVITALRADAIRKEAIISVINGMEYTLSYYNLTPPLEVPKKRNSLIDDIQNEIVMEKWPERCATYLFSDLQDTDLIVSAKLLAILYKERQGSLTGTEYFKVKNDEHLLRSLAQVLLSTAVNYRLFRKDYTTIRLLFRTS